jgi:hypothetical protein
MEVERQNLKAELLALMRLHLFLYPLTAAALARCAPENRSTSTSRVPLADVLIASTLKIFLPFQRGGATVHL